jgi:lipopolysaccharide/colanic/teichoic acid biosynthesis glycosyltransferase
MAPSRRKARAQAAKTVLDYVLATSFLIVSAPLFLLIALGIKLTSAGPVFFVQQRVGQGGRVFPFYKFRTMKHNADDSAHREFSRDFILGAQGDGGAPERRNGKGSAKDPGRAKPGARVYKLMGDPRVTAIGHLLRRTSLDELPQLLNVLRGDMSLVGPRPPVLYEIEHYQEWHKKRLEAKPGITGLWQVSGRSSVPFDEMVLLDLYYIEHRSTMMDLRIMAKTLPVMFTGNGAY